MSAMELSEGGRRQKGMHLPRTLYDRRHCRRSSAPFPFVYIFYEVLLLCT